MRIKDYTDTIRHLTDPFNIPEARRMIQENPALTQEQFKAGGIVESGVTHYAKKKGVGKGGNPASWGHRKIDVDLNKIIKLRKEGLTLTQIAKGS